MGGKKPIPDPKEENLFISTFDLDRRHIALFQRSVSGLDAASMSLAGGREASGSHWVLFVSFVLFCLFPIKLLAGKEPQEGFRDKARRK